MPPTRSNTNATIDASPSPEPQPGKELPERSRNAKAQARHREKRKAYISHLEASVASLKQQLASMGISGAIPAHALNAGSPTSQSETDARLRELVEENERLKTEIQRLRARVESMAAGGSGAGTGSSSRSSTGGNHHGLTPPATPFGGGGNSSGALLPAATSSDEAYDGRRGSVMGGPVESFLASAFVPFLTISPPPTLSSCSLPSQPLFSSSSPSSRSLLDSSSPYISASNSPYYTNNNSASPSPYPSNSPSPIPNAHLAHPALSASFAQFGMSSPSAESAYPYPSSSSRMSLQSFAIM